jgi:peptide/nickel transport system substrate-binding protein
LYFFADEKDALEALKTGSIDALSSISATSAVALPSDNPDTNYRVTSTPLPRIFGVFFNQNNNPVLADKTVRHALDLAIDRQTIVDTVLFGYGTPITGPFPVNKTIRRSLTTSTSSNITMAMDILESKDWKKNQEGIYHVKTKTSTQRLAFTLYTANTPDLKETATLLKESWLRLGVDVEVKIFEANDLYQNIIRTRKYDALLFGEQIGTDRDLYAFWHSSQRTAPGLNVSMYTNSKADALLEDIEEIQRVRGTYCYRYTRTLLVFTRYYICAAKKDSRCHYRQREYTCRSMEFDPFMVHHDGKRMEMVHEHIEHYYYVIHIYE